MIHHVTRATRHLIFWSLISLAIGITAVRIIMMEVEGYKAELQSEISSILQTPVKIGKLRANMRGFSPELVFKEIQIQSTPKQPGSGIQLQQLRLGVHLLQYLLTQDLLSSAWVSLVGVKLTLKQHLDGHFSIPGFESNDQNDPVWLLQGGRFEIIQSELTLIDEATPEQHIHLSSVNAVLKNDALGNGHQAHVLIQLPEKYGEQLRLSAEFEGNIFKTKQFNGQLYIDGKQLQLTKLSSKLPTDFSLTQGRSDIKLWSHWQDSKLQNVSGQLRLMNTQLDSSQQKSLFINALQSQFLCSRTNQGWQLNLIDFALDSADKKWPEATLALNLKLNKDNVPISFSSYIKTLDVQEASNLANFFAPAFEYSDWLNNAWQGQLKDWYAYVDLTENQYAFQGEFDHLAWLEKAPLPGVDGLSGYITANHHQGRIWLNSQQMEISLTQLFREPFANHNLIGVIDFKNANNAWSVSSPQLELSSSTLTTKTRFNIEQQAEQSRPLIDVQMGYSSSDVSHAKDYLPVAIMDTDVVDWLDNAFIKGSGKNGKTLFYGNLEDYPFLASEGDFKISFDTPDMELNFDSDWPNLEALNASVSFTYDSVNVDIHSARSEDLTVQPSVVSIDSFERSYYVDVKAKINGQINSVLSYLQKSPIAYQIDPVMDAIIPSGNNTVVVDTVIKAPMSVTLDAKVDGSAQLINHQLSVRSLDLPVTEINGLLKFNEQGVYSERLDAVALGHPIEIKVNSDNYKTQVNVNGVMDDINLQKQFDLSWLKMAKGEADYALQLDLPYQANKSPTIDLHSDLVGIKLTLPEKLKKTTQQKKSLELKFFLTEGNLLPIQLNYAQKLKATFDVDLNKQAVDSGYFLIGQGQVKAKKYEDITLEINRPKIDLNQWLALAAAGTEGQEKIDIIKLHSQHAYWKNRNLGNLDLTLHKLKQSWQAQIKSPIAKGTVLVPDDLTGNNKIKLDMDYLDISSFAVLTGDGKSMLPTEFPLISLHSKKLMTGASNWGELQVETEREAQGIFIRQAKLESKHDSLSFNGNWLASGGKSSKTMINGHLTSQEFGHLLTRLNISDDIKETEAKLDFDLHWPGTPAQVSLKNLNGYLDADLEEGRVLGIEPGLGRILGIIALDQWTKRLRLDFSDLYKAGLAFNGITGHFVLADGKATNKNLNIDAVSAKITITGETDLVAKQFNQKVTVVPKSSEAVPIAGTIVREVAALVAKSLTGDKQEGFFFGSQFLVKGDWSNAEIIPQHEHDGLVKKTWHGITGFLRKDQNNYKENKDE